MYAEWTKTDSCVIKSVLRNKNTILMKLIIFLEQFMV